MNPWPDLRPILTDIPWAIVGEVATRAYMPERLTKDLDIIVHEQDEENALTSLQGAGYKIVTQLNILGYLLQAPDGTEVDLLLGNYPWLEQALSQPQQDKADYPVIDLPYLVLLKLEASRGRDVGDLATMLGWADEDMLRRVRIAVDHYAPQDIDDLEALIFLGQQERGGDFSLPSK